MAATTDYDHSSIRIDPAGVEAAQKTMAQHAQDIGDAVVGIQHVLEGLHGSWVGESAQRAQDFNERWNTLMTGLFGTKAAAKSGKFSSDVGVLNVLAGGLHSVAVAYSQTDNAIAMMFMTYLWGTVSGSGKGGGTPQPGDPSLSGSGSDPGATAIKETF